MNDKTWFFDFLNELMESEGGLSLDVVKDTKDIKKNIEIIPQKQGIYLYAIAISKLGMNTSIQLSCKKGKPISNATYNVQRDICLVDGIDYIDLGPVKVNYLMKIKDYVDYTIDIPVPEYALKRYFNDSQKQLFTSFKNKYKDTSKYCVKYLQVIKASRY